MSAVLQTERRIIPVPDIHFYKMFAKLNVDSLVLIAFDCLSLYAKQISIALAICAHKCQCMYQSVP